MKFVKLFLIFSLIFQSFYLYAQQACVNKDNTIAPAADQRTTKDGDGKDVDTQVWKDWKSKYSSDWEARQNWKCCEHLVLNTSTRVCEDQSVKDGDLKSCTDHSECPGDLGCLPWREDDQFNEERVSSEAEKEALSKKADEFQKARDEFEDLSENGGFCITNMMCESYKCEGFTCKENKICRLAGVEDPSTPNKVKCEKPYEKNNLGKCYDPNATFFVGLLGKINVNQVGGEKCQYELVPTEPGTTTNDIPGAINLAIASTRGMEWLFSTISPTDSMGERDCVYSRDYLRDRAKELVNERKKIIEAFNSDIKMVEDDYAIIMSAKENDQTQVKTLCDNEMVSKHEIYTRKATGKDFLCYMHSRNVLFKAYETAMKDWTNKFHNAIKTYEDNIKNWEENKKEWDLNGKHWKWKEARTCRYWVNLLVGIVTPRKIKNRWIDRYRMKMDNPNEMFNKYIKTIEPGAADRVKNWNWMLDTLQPGHDGMDVQKYLKSLRTNSIPESEFIHEPEMAASYDLRGCIAKVNDPACARYKKYIEDISNIALAQKIMYSQHDKRKFKSFYQNEGSGRRRLLSRYITDTINLQNYYEASISLRDKQNACIEKVLNQLNGSDFDGKGTGITQGSTNYYQSTDTNYVNGKNDDKNYNKPKVKKLSLTPMKFKLSAYKSSLKDGAYKDSIESSSAGSGSVGDASSSALAARTKALQDANAAAQAKGIDVNKMNKDLREELRKSDLLTGASNGAGGGSGSRGGSSNTSLNSGADGKKATLDETGVADANAGKGEDSKGGAVTAGAAGGGASGNGSGSLSSAFSSGDGSGSNGNGAHQDPTGMSDEEKDIMSANYDRNKGDYKTKEDDSLFQVLSKTYVRNLDKILTRKKKLDDDSASHPSSPSTP